MEEVFRILKQIDDENPKDVLTRIAFYHDGSGEILPNKITFDNLDQAKEVLKKLINK